MSLATTIAVPVAALMIGTPVQLASAGQPRTKEQCTALFHLLDRSGDGKLPIQDLRAHRVLMRAIDDPAIRDQGYITQAQFLALCVTSGDASAPRG